MTWGQAPTTDDRVRRWLADLRRAASWHRRLLAAGLLAGSVAFALQALAPSAPPSLRVVVAAHDLATGARLTPDDVRIGHWPVARLPAGALASPTAAVGRSVVSAVRAGELLTDARLVGRALLRGLPTGLVAAPVRVADAEAAALVQPGDTVDVLASPATPGAEAVTQARVVAAAVQVLSVPRSESSRLGAGLGDGSLLLVATTGPTAARLAAAAVTDRLSLVIHRS